MRSSDLHRFALLAALLTAPAAGCESDVRTVDDGASDGDTDADSDADTDADADADADADEYCPHIDILFMIDNSGSMVDNQDSVIASFPGFVSAIQEQLVHAPSYHIGVVVPDLSKTNPAGCRDIGDLITSTVGAPLSGGQVCTPFASGGSYLDDTEPDLAGKFACVAKIGAGGADDERPMRAIMDALSPGKNAAGACNEGFHRPDSVLVLVIMTDEDDVKDGCDEWDNCESYGSGGTPDEWTETIVGYKNGHAENVVVLSIIGLSGDNDCGAVPAAKLIGFTNNFENSYKGDVCAGSYDDYFAAALPIISEACMEWDIE
jgi:hypothetical protein